MISRTRILVVDDELGIVSLCKRLLERAGYDVIGLTDPVAALDFLKREKVDLLLVDIRMPAMSGFDLIASVQNKQPEMAILIMTGFGTVETAIQALRQGVDGLLLKPFDSSQELLHAVQQALADSQQKRDIARIQALRPLFDITESFLAETRPDRLLELVVNATCGHLRCNHAAYYRYSPESGMLERVTGRGITPPDEMSGLSSGLIGRTDALSAPLWVSIDAHDESDLMPALAELGLCSALAAPVVRQKVRGVLFAGREEGAPVFREIDVEMFLLLSRQAGIALENALLYEELREYVRRVEESQQALIRAEKLATAGRLTASIAHEINNPLQSVQNCLHLASHPEISSEKREEFLQLAATELDRLMNTVQRMLDYYRPAMAERQRVDIPLLVKHVLGLMSSQLEERKIRVTTGFSSKLPAIMAVKSQLEQVFINLILNAYDAMPQGGELHISGRLARDMVEIIFEDTGPGVPPEERTRIFEPFVSTKENGTGLGLSVSYGIIAAHGGSLDLISGRGKGACFRILLPVKGQSHVDQGKYSDRG